MAAEAHHCSRGITITGMFNAHHARTGLGCRPAPVRVVRWRLLVPGLLVPIPTVKWRSG